MQSNLMESIPTPCKKATISSPPPQDTRHLVSEEMETQRSWLRTPGTGEGKKGAVTEKKTTTKMTKWKL